VFLELVRYHWWPVTRKKMIIWKSCSNGVCSPSWFFKVGIFTAKKRPDTGCFSAGEVGLIYCCIKENFSGRPRGWHYYPGPKIRRCWSSAGFKKINHSVLPECFPIQLRRCMKTFVTHQQNLSLGNDGFMFFEPEKFLWPLVWFSYRFPRHCLHW